MSKKDNTGFEESAEVFAKGLQQLKREDKTAFDKSMKKLNDLDKLLNDLAKEMVIK